MVESFGFAGTGLLVVLGMGLGYHVAELQRRYPEADLVVVEAKREIRDFCGTHGKGAEFAGNVRLIVGTPPGEAIAEIARLHRQSGLPPLAVFSHAPEVAAFPDYYNPIRKALEKTESFRLWDRLRYPKFRKEFLTVALFDFGYFLTEEIARAVKALGHAVVRVPGNKDGNFTELSGRVLNAVAAHRPDFFLTVNHLGFDEEGILADLFESIEMPAAIWYVDSPNLIVKGFAKNATPHSSVFLWDEGYRKDLETIGFENVVCLPLAADETVFRPMELLPSVRRKMGAAVGFVGNSMVVPARDRLRKVPGGLHPAVERAARWLAGSRAVPFRDVLEQTMEPWEREELEAMPESWKTGFEAAVLWRATLLYRLECLDALREFHPVVRGDAGWKRLANGRFRIGPAIDYYRELPLHYNACTINFNATNVQMGTAVNQRVFDAPACGAFLLTDHQESIERLFEVGKEIVTYRNKGEIADLARFYLANGPARQAVATKGRERVLAEHTYRHRIGTIARFLRKTYG